MCERAYVETSKDKYYMEICKTLNYYNEFNTTPLPNAKISESIRKVMEEESIADSKNVTADTFSRASNTQRKNSNAIFTNEKLDKSDEIVDTAKNLKINDA